MPVILSQKGDCLVRPIYVEVHDDGFIFARVWKGERDGVYLGKYKDYERAKEVLRAMFQTEYYEMPLE
jgi:hypothetical protein